MVITRPALKWERQFMLDKESVSEEDGASMAWTYYSHAETMFHSRFESFLIAEAFLVGAFATIMTIPQPNEAHDLKSTLVRMSIVLVGLLLTWQFRLALTSVHGKMTYLKENYLAKNPVWRDFTQATRALDRRRWHLHRMLPLCFLVFWLLVGWLVLAPLANLL